MISRNPSKIWIADGSAGGDTIDKFEFLGYIPVAERANATLVDLNHGEMVNVSVPDGLIFKSFLFNRIVVEADVLISVACMKTHEQAVVTLGMKNLIGIVPGSIYGFPKQALHEAARDMGDKYMAGVITDICAARKIDLVIIDGRIGMEGQGPGRGTPVKLDLIIVGTDPVATDAVASAIMGFDWEKVPSVRLGHDRGLGIGDLRRIEIKGERLEDIFHPFKPARGHERFLLLPASHLAFYRSKAPLTIIAAACWILTLIFLLIRKR